MCRPNKPEDHSPTNDLPTGNLAKSKKICLDGERFLSLQNALQTGNAIPNQNQCRGKSETAEEPDKLIVTTILTSFFGCQKKDSNLRSRKAPHLQCGVIDRSTILAQDVK